MGKAGKPTRPRVYARLRPMFGRDAGQPVLFRDTDTALEYQKEEGAEMTKYEFDRVFGMEATQESVYETIGDVALQSLRQGFNSTILAYGQTGSGKTFSMEGAKDKDGNYISRGLIPRIFENIFKLFLNEADVKGFEVGLSFVELYNEQLQDLLQKRKVVEVTSDNNGGYKARDAVYHKCEDAHDAQRIYLKGCDQRATASTNMNEQSSRSHALLQLTVQWVDSKGKSFGVLNLVDLAGSEGMKKTGATGQNAKEGIKINLSLTKLAFVVKCLAEGSKHIPFRDSKLTMMLATGLGGKNLLHIILALSNSREQISEGTACLRFGQSCLSMTTNASANKVEKEAAEMKSLIKEQMAEINDLQSENEALKRMLEEQKNAVATEVPEAMVAKYIAVNKDALQEDIREAAEQMEELRAMLAEKKAELDAMKGDDGAAEAKLLQAFADDEGNFAGMDAQQRAEAMEAYQKKLRIDRMKMEAEIRQEIAAQEAEISQVDELKKGMEDKLTNADGVDAMERERIRQEVEEQQGAARAAIEEKAAQMEAALRFAEKQESEREEQRKKQEAHMQEELRKKEETLRKEEEMRRQLEEATAAEAEELKKKMVQLANERAMQEKQIERANQAQARLAHVEAEARAALEAKKQQEAELVQMREQIAQMAEEQALRARNEGKGPIDSSAFGMFEPAKVMIKKTAAKHEAAGKSGKRGDLTSVQRILETLPVLTACNDLRALCELDPANRALFVSLGGIRRMIDFLAPTGPQAPYATHVARTLPCVITDSEARQQFWEYASMNDRDGKCRFSYIKSLLKSTDPDDREHACIALASIAQDSPANRKSMFDHGISSEVYTVLHDSCKSQVPRQRLQRVVVLALAELANDFDPFKNELKARNGVPMLLQLLQPTNDPFVIKECLQLAGRITVGNAGIQADLQQYGAVDTYSQLLFAQDILHDQSISELAALALVNLVSEAPACLRVVEAHPKYTSIRYDILASMARALSSSMQRLEQDEQAVPGSADFAFWGHSIAGEWDEGTSGGDRMNCAFSDNPQFVLRASAGTNMCIVVQDLEEEKRQKEKSNLRPVFLRCAIAEASRDAINTGFKMLDVNSSGARPCAIDKDGVMQLEPAVTGFIDVAKTREIVMKVKVKRNAKDGCWVVVPHCGCQHQFSKFVMTVFADQEIAIEGELQPWSKRVIKASWNPLCSAPNNITDAMWRNCPQFQLINMSSERTPVRAMLSYAERDEQHARRHQHAVDKGPLIGTNDMPMLALYVMKANVPDKRYVGNLSPQVENYAAHSLITNSWCVQCKWELEPGDVYSMIAVMTEATTHEVPLHLTVFYSPEEEESTIVLMPLSPSAEYFCTVVQGHTDETGFVQLHLVPQNEVGTVQCTIVLEILQNDVVFCSIASYDREGVPHKQTPTFSQKSAVLSVPFAAQEEYMMSARCITQRQEPVRGQLCRLLIYSTREMQVSPGPDQAVSIDLDGAMGIVSRETSDIVTYGEEVTDKMGKPEAPEEEHELEASPAVIMDVLHQLEEQRDNLYAYTRDELKSEAPAVLEALRRKNDDLEHAKSMLTMEYEKLKAETASLKASKDAGPGMKTDSAQVAELQKQLAAAQAEAKAALAGKTTANGTGGSAEVAALQAKLAEQEEELEAERQMAQRAVEMATRAAAEAAEAMAQSGDGGGDEELRQQLTMLEKKAELQGEALKQADAERQAAQEQAELAKKQAKSAKRLLEKEGSADAVSQAEAEAKADEYKAKAKELKKTLKATEEEKRAALAEVAEMKQKAEAYLEANPKASKACVVQ